MTKDPDQLDVEMVRYAAAFCALRSAFTAPTTDTVRPARLPTSAFLLFPSSSRSPHFAAFRFQLSAFPISAFPQVPPRRAQFQFQSPG